MGLIYLLTSLTQVFYELLKKKPKNMTESETNTTLLQIAAVEVAVIKKCIYFPYKRRYNNKTCSFKFLFFAQIVRD